MSVLTLVAAIIFLGAVVLSQKIAVNAGARLDDAIKLKLIEVFPKRNANYTMIVFGLIIAFLLAAYAFPSYATVISIIYAGAFVAYLFAKLFLNVRKLREIGAPEFYINNVVASFGVFIGGAIAAAIIFGIGNSWRGN